MKIYKVVCFMMLLGSRETLCVTLSQERIDAAAAAYRASAEATLWRARCGFAAKVIMESAALYRLVAPFFGVSVPRTMDVSYEEQEKRGIASFCGSLAKSVALFGARLIAVSVINKLAAPMIATFSPTVMVPCTSSWFLSQGKLCKGMATITPELAEFAQDVQLISHGFATLALYRGSDEQYLACMLSYLASRAERAVGYLLFIQETVPEQEQQVLERCVTCMYTLLRDKIDTTSVSERRFFFEGRIKVLQQEFALLYALPQFQVTIV